MSALLEPRCFILHLSKFISLLFVESTENRIPPIKWQGEVISDVTVLQANESIPDFEIRITPYNCAYDFPLIAVSLQALVAYCILLFSH